VTIAVELLDSFAADAAARLAPELNRAGSIILTGGTTAAAVYSLLPEGCFRPGTSVFFSDERCVPVDHEASIYAMAAARLSLSRDDGVAVHRMRGEDEPEQAAVDYHNAIAPVAARGIDVALLGLGTDCHVAGLFPGSPALEPSERLCAAVDRPDGMRGLTLTPPALTTARKVFVIVSGQSKREAVGRLLRGNEAPNDCPARLLAALPDLIVLGERDSIAAT
jgi:6-phosphogluconolactonase